MRLSSNAHAFVFLHDHFLTALQRMGHMRRHSTAGSQHSSHQEVMNEMVDMGELEETERQAARPFWMRVRFYQILIPLLVSAILILVGVLLAAYQPVSVSFLAVHSRPRFDNCKMLKELCLQLLFLRLLLSWMGSIVVPVGQQGRSTTSYTFNAAHKLHM